MKNPSTSSLNKVDSVYATLEDRISSGVWPVGSQAPTELELAEELDCSRSTISKAMARLANDGWVDRKTRAGTRIISSNPTKTISGLSLDACALIYPSEQHEGVRRIMTGFQTAAHRARRQTVMLSTGTDFAREAEAVGRLDEFDVKGAVLLPVVLTPNDYVNYSQMLLACRYPVVTVTLDMGGLRRPSVVVDGFHAGLTATRHLLEKGHRQVGFLANHAWTTGAQHKYLGYRQAMEEAGLGEQTVLTQRVAEMRPNFDDPLSEPERLAHDYLLRHPTIEAVVCASDFIALAMLRAARAQGRRVPEDLKVVGIDDYEAAEHAEVPLTTYHVPYEQMGERSFELLNDLLGGVPVVPLDSQVRGHLVTRASSGD